MGGNTINATVLQQKAKDVYAMYPKGTDFTNPIKYTDEETGAIFTFKKDAESGEVKCTYSYHHEESREIMLFPKNTLALNGARTGSLTPDLTDMFNANNPGNYYASNNQYAAANEAVEERNRLISQLNAYDSKVRDNAREQLRKLDQTEIIRTGYYDARSAKKMAKYDELDARAGNKSSNTTVYIDKDAYKAAKKALKEAKKAAEKRIKAARNNGFLPSEEDLAIMEKEVKYVSDKDVRKYIEAHKEDRVDPVTGRVLHKGFYVNGQFSSERYIEWATTLAQGDHTLTTSERTAASQATGLSGRDCKHAVRDANLRTQRDRTLEIKLLQSAVGLLMGALTPYLMAQNVHSVDELKDKIQLVADAADPCKYTVFIDGQSVATATNELFVNFKDPAALNGLLGALIGELATSAWFDPKGTAKAEAMTASTIATQNIFRGQYVHEENGEIVVDEPEVITEEYVAELFQLGEVLDDCDKPVTFNINGHKTGRKDGQGHDIWRAHLWDAFYAAYDIPENERSAFRKAYRAKYLGGNSNAFYKNGDNTHERCFEFNGRTISFDLDKFNNTWTDYTRESGNVRSLNVNHQISGGDAEFYGSAGYRVPAGEGSFHTNPDAHHRSEQAAREDLIGQILSDQTLTQEQKARQLARLQSTQVQPAPEQ